MSESTTEKLIHLISPLVEPLGYEIVHLEVLTGRQKILRIFIDRLQATDGQGVGIQDCVTVTRALDEPLDQIPEVDKAFGGASYELEVSSPGVDRPLRQAKDFQRFSGRDVRIHVFRPLTAEELGNAGYQTKNPRQKNFLGKLVGFKNDRVLLAINANAAGGGKPGKKGASKSAQATNSAEEISIPLPLISKANLEPVFDFDRPAESEIES